jgi:hypothetical protein
MIAGATGSPAMGTKNGSLASYFYAPNPTPGRGVCFSPNGELLLRYGCTPEIKVIRASSATVVVTLKGSVGAVRFATFSTNGRFIVAATDGGCSAGALISPGVAYMCIPYMHACGLDTTTNNTLTCVCGLKS